MLRIAAYRSGVTPSAAATSSGEAPGPVSSIACLMPSV
jgi:hypothetical protein